MTSTSTHDSPISRLAARWRNETRTLGPIAGRLGRDARDLALGVASACLCLAPHAAIALVRRVLASRVTIAIATLHLGVFIAIDRSGGADAVREFFAFMSCSYVDVREGDWWRLLTSGWAHLDWEHVTTNAAFLIVLGILLEPAIGSRAFAMVYGISQIGAAGASLLFDTGLCAGASGAVFGVLGALVVCPAFADRFLSRVAWMALACFSAGYLTSLESDRIGNAAHAAGFVSGMLAAAGVGRFSIPVFYGTRRRQIASAFAGALVVAFAIAPDPQWRLILEKNLAEWESRPGRLDSSECRWERIEHSVDADRESEARLLAHAAGYHAGRGEFLQARTLLERAAPTLGAETYRHLGDLQAWSEPCDDLAAFVSYRTSLSLSSHEPETLDDLAQLLLWTTDSLLFNPRLAASYAHYAVVVNERPEYLRTLAWTRFACGDRRAAVRAIRRALALSPENPREYETDLVTMTRSSPAWEGVRERDRWMEAHETS